MVAPLALCAHVHCALARKKLKLSLSFKLKAAAAVGAVTLNWEGGQSREKRSLNQASTSGHCFVQFR